MALGRAQDTPPTLASSPATSTAVASATPPSIPGGGEATATTATSDHGAPPDLGIGRADASSSAPTLTMTGAAPAHVDAPAQFTPVASAIADLPQLAVAHSDMADASSAGGGEIARGSDLASLDSSSSSYADHGWFIVPSADNEYGQAAYAAADDYGWSVAAGEFSTDWFIA